MVSVGITGSRNGMSESQKALLMDILMEDFDEYHHGDCIGVDEQFHNLVVEKLKYNIYRDRWIVIHPPSNNKCRAYCDNCTMIYEEKPYLERNKDIVDECDLLIAIPDKDCELNRLRSGTWSTIRYAKKKGKDVIIII